jgi:hypothetical protein
MPYNDTTVTNVKVNLVHSLCGFAASDNVVVRWNPSWFRNTLEFFEKTMQNRYSYLRVNNSFSLLDLQLS